MSSIQPPREGQPSTYEITLKYPHSTIQEYFTLQTINCTLKKKCKFCSKSYSTETAASNLLSHYEKKHTDLYLAYEKKRKPSTKQKSAPENDGGDKSQIDLSVEIPPDSRVPSRVSDTSLVLDLGETFAVLSPANATSSSSSSSSSLTSPLSLPTSRSSSGSKPPRHTNAKSPTWFSNYLPFQVINQNNLQLPSATARAFACTNQSHLTLENPEFQQWLSIYRNSNASLPNRKELPQLMQKEKSRLKNVVDSNLLSGVTTIAIDCATDNRVSVTNILAINEGKEYFLKRISNVSEINSAPWIFDRIKPVIQDLLDKGVNIVGFVTDNASNMLNVCDMVSKEWPFINTVPCIAHIIQIIVKKLLRIPAFQVILLVCVSFFSA